MEENYGKTNLSVYWVQKPPRNSLENWNTTDVSFMKPSRPSLLKIRNLFYLPVRTFSVDTRFPVRFLNIFALGDWMKFPYFTQCIHLWCFCWKHCFVVMLIITGFTSTKDYLWLWHNKYRNVERLVLIYLSMYFNFQHLEKKLSRIRRLACSK